MESRKVLMLEFKSKRAKKVTIQVRQYADNLTGATIKSVMESLLACGGLKVVVGDQVEEAVSIQQAYYSVQVIENIVINNGDLQEQLRL